MKGATQDDAVAGILEMSKGGCARPDRARDQDNLDCRAAAVSMVRPSSSALDPTDCERPCNSQSPNDKLKNNTIMDVPSHCLSQVIDAPEKISSAFSPELFSTSTAHESTAPTTKKPPTTCDDTAPTMASSETPTTPIGTTSKWSDRPKRRGVSQHQAPRVSKRQLSALPSPWKECRVHRPSLDEIRSQSLTDYVRHVVLRSACQWQKEENGEVENESNIQETLGAGPYWTRTAKAETLSDWEDLEELPLDQGMAKVSLPDGFWSEEGIGKDRSGRGGAWQAGTHLGDYVLSSPIQQHVRGLAGVYEFTFTEQPAMTIAAFRMKADEYRRQVVGYAFDEEDTSNQDGCKGDEAAAQLMAQDNARMAELERLFWKRLSPTMPPAWYGADEEGSFFGDDDASGWAINKLDSCLHLLSDVPGVTTPYLYLGMWASCFAAHTEDINLLSINYLHAGAPKIWYAIAPGRDARRFEELAAFNFRHAEQQCKEFLRHKRYILSPHILQKAGIPFTTMVQYPGEAMITFPGGYHFGFNSGYNVAEATNFGVPEWIPFGLRARICLCRPDSVRIDMHHFIFLLNQYEEYVERQKRKGRRAALLSCKQWAHERVQGRGVRIDKSADKEHEQKDSKRLSSKEQNRRDFYIEVVQPIPAAKSSTTSKEKRSSRCKSKTGRLATHKANDVWHLARPIIKRLEVETPVLVLLHSSKTKKSSSVPKKKVWKRWDASSDEEDEEEPEEQCFSGIVTEMSDGHVRVHLNGLSKSEDVWIPIDSPKLFLDGGRWEESKDQGLPALHYWRESDSRNMVF